jgi:hypothetical protein
MSFPVAFGIGAAAAFAAEFLPIHALRYTPREKWPKWVTSKMYWTLTILGCLLGGVFAGAYSTSTKLTWYLAANVGAAWPSIINALARAAPELRASDSDVN